jgi:hypothetical protein
MLSEYHKYHTNRDNTRIGLLEALQNQFEIQKVLYPGSYTDITPSLVFSEVVYVDSANKFKKFSEDTIEIETYITEYKKYTSKPCITFHYSDYYKDLGEDENSFDLLLSQYAGFISKACHKYLKPAGILVCNNSHGDVDWARLSGLYDFIGVYNRKTDTEYNLNFEGLDGYFVPKKPQEISLDILEKKQTGFGYTKSPSGYIFRKK